MKRMKRFLSILLVMLLLFTVAPIKDGTFTKVYAATNSKASAVVNNICSTVGFRPGVDNYNDCYAFASAFCNKMYGSAPGGTSGYTLTRPGNFYLVGQTTGTGVSAASLSSLLSQAMPGDVVQMYWYTNSKLNQSSQHTAIVYSADANSFTVLQDGASWSTIQKSTYSYSNYYTRWRGAGYGISLYRHSNYNSLFGGSAVGELTIPVINTNKNYYHVGEKAEIKWTASSPNTDFYQYWLIIKNNTSNKVVFGGASGENGNVYANSYNYNITQKGEYLITVYAVPYNNKETRQKVYTKKFYVDTESKTIDDDEYHIISALGTDMTLDVSGTSTGNEANVQIWHNLWNPQQTWNVKYLTNGVYTIIFKYSGKSLDVRGGSKEIGANVQQYTYGGAAQQQWIIKPTSDGKWYNIISVHTGYYLTVTNGNSANGTNVEMRPSDGSNAQKWKFSSVNHVHQYSKAITKDLTCISSGSVSYTCSCGDSYTETVPATGHTFGSWQTTKKATYTATGTQTRTCTKCGATETKTIAKLKTTAISACTITVNNATYTGKAVSSSLTVKNGKTTLKSGTHYTVSYKNNTKIGKGTVTIKGVEKNGYSGSKSLTFNILPAKVTGLKAASQTTTSIKLTWSKVAGATGYRVYKYDSANKKWVKVADTKNTNYTISKLKAGTSYKYAVKAYATVNKVTYWSASYPTLTTSTKPATPTLKATAGTKQAALSWNKISGATGYEVYMSTKKDSGFKKATTIKKNATVKYTKKDLKKGTTYYFKVRAYKTVDGKNVYGAYSAVKSAKAK